MQLMSECLVAMPSESPSRERLTLGWRGKSAPVPDVVFDDAPPEQVAPVVAIKAAPVVVNPVLHCNISQERYETIKAMVDLWADWMVIGRSTADGAPNQSAVAPDARIHSIEDLEIESDRLIVRAVQTAVWELALMEREAVMCHYGLNTRSVWRTQFDKLFDMAIESLYQILRNRIAC